MKSKVIMITAILVVICSIMSPYSVAINQTAQIPTQQSKKFPFKISHTMIKNPALPKQQPIIIHLTTKPEKYKSIVSSSSNTIQENNIHQLINNNENLNPRILKLGLTAYRWAKMHRHVQKTILTIVNFNMPSRKKRLWVIDLHTDKILAYTLVANGKDKNFSNQLDSDGTSLGIYLTGNTYIGKHGYSLRLHGLEKGINNNAYARAVVIHPAWYVSTAFAKKYGRLGRSWGCFALNKQIASKIIHIIKNGSVLFAYATLESHDPNLLKS